MAIITLTTDFGLEDSYVAQMKGVILGICPAAQIVDVTHAIPPQDVQAGAFAIAAAAGAFPEGTIHVGVVDPGVGTQRKAVAIEFDGGFCVGPDNGLFGLLPCRRAVELTNPAYHHPPVSATFHGRDIFAPVAAHLACGAPLDQLGQPTELQPSDTPGDLRVLSVDHFGNVITSARAWPQGQTITLGDCEITQLHRTFGDVPPGDPVAYLGSGGFIEIAIRNASAATRFNLTPGDPLRTKHRDSSRSDKPY